MDNVKYAFFDFDEDRYLVEYRSETDIGDEIEDALSSWADGEEPDDSPYEDIVKGIMDSFGVEWRFLPVRKYWV